MEMNVSRQIWEGLNEQWKIANQNARLARHQATAAFAACMAGQGPGPNQNQLVEVERLERLADECRMAEEAFMKSVFG